MLKVCIIGNSGHYGYVTERAGKKNGDFYIAAVTDGPEKSGTDYIDMLEKEKLDIAVVNPYLVYNSQVSIECLQRDINVFSDKPSATTLEDLSKLKKAYSESSKVYSTMMACGNKSDY